MASLAMKLGLEKVFDIFQIETIGNLSVQFWVVVIPVAFTAVLALVGYWYVMRQVNAVTKVEGEKVRIMLQDVFYNMTIPDVDYIIRMQDFSKEKRSECNAKFKEFAETFEKNFSRSSPEERKKILAETKESMVKGVKGLLDPEVVDVLCPELKIDRLESLNATRCLRMIREVMELKLPEPSNDMYPKGARAILGGLLDTQEVREYEDLALNVIVTVDGMLEKPDKEERKTLLSFPRVLRNLCLVSLAIEVLQRWVPSEDLRRYEIIKAGGAQTTTKERVSSFINVLFSVAVTGLSLYVAQSAVTGDGTNR